MIIKIEISNRAVSNDKYSSKTVICVFEFGQNRKLSSKILSKIGQKKKELPERKIGKIGASLNIVH